MAFTNFTAISDFEVWLDALNGQIALQSDSIMAPLRQIHNFQNIPDGAGQEAVIFPYATGTLAMSAISEGTETDSASQFPVNGQVVTPVGYEAQIIITEYALRKNPAGYMTFVAGEFARSAHTALIGVLTNLYDNLTVSGSSGADLSPTTFLTGITAMKTKGISGPYKAVLHSAAFSQLMSNATNIATYGSVGADAVYNGNISHFMGVDIYEDSKVGNDGTDYENFLGTQDCIGVAVGQEPNLKVVTPLDGSHIKLCYTYWFAAAVVASNRGVWLKSDYEG
jgi:hypothetical protein